MQQPPYIAPLACHDAEQALAQVQRIYAQSVAFLREAFERCVAGDEAAPRVRACYPFVRLQTPRPGRARARLSYGFVAAAGTYETTLTRPDLFAEYLREQFALLLENHGGPIEVGTSRQPIALPFAFPDHDLPAVELTDAQRQRLRTRFDFPDLTAMDDRIANGTYEPAAGEPLPLALFTAPRVDYSLARLRHYTGTAPEHFQHFVLFTNYPFYVDAFVGLARALMRQPAPHDQHLAFVEPGPVITYRGGATTGAPPGRLPQMPAYHLVRGDRSGITLVNIGVGPSNAKTITDHIAVLRPHAWIMLGHCAGLRITQRLGDYVLAHAYVREDHVLDEDLPPWVPIPALAEV
ncbi:MAG: AMP nucleosidase, partial [Burkholderiaceae bacterium]|nr:AMP nucleosidase [Burkholderiaceae bacterium]